MVTSKRPYLLRAINEWILDNHMTPHILVDAATDNVAVPRQYVEDGRIVLNISPAAVRDLEIGNEKLVCGARFSGNAFTICVPILNILAIFAKENGMGIVFSEETTDESAAPETERLEKAPHLKLVK